MKAGKKPGKDSEPQKVEVVE